MRNTVPVLKVEISQGMESWELPIVRVYVTEEGTYVLIEAMAFLEEAIAQGIADSELGNSTVISGRIERVPANRRRRRIRRGGAA